MLELFSHLDTWVALASLAGLEIVLGIDNIVFIAILTAKLPKHQQLTAYRLRLGAALLSRIVLLFAISLVIHLTEPLFTVLLHDLSLRSFILLGRRRLLLPHSSL